jgi:hypothetical protein
MNKTTYDRVMEEGLERGVEEGLRRAILRQGTRCFREAPSEEIKARITAMDDVVLLEKLLDRVLDVQSWAELLQD